MIDGKNVFDQPVKNKITWKYHFIMAQYNSLNVRLSNSQLNKLKSAIKNKTEVILRLSSNIKYDW